MSEPNNRQLRGELARVAREMEKMADAGLNTDADRAKFGRLKSESRDLKDRIEAYELGMQMRQTGPPPNGQPGNFEDHQDGGENRASKKAFNSFLRMGLTGMSDEERSTLRRAETRDMGEAGLGSGAATAGGVLVPVGFVQQIEEAMKYYGPMLVGTPRAPTVMPTATGQSLPWPTDNDTTVVGERIGEGQQVSTADVNLGQVIFGAWKYSSKMVKVSMELLQDSAFDLEGYLADKLAVRLARIINTDLTVGTGTSQPNGIITAAVSAGTAIGSLANDGVGGFNTIGSDDLTALEHSVDPAYRIKGCYMFHDQTLKYLKTLKDKYGRPLWMTDVRVGEQFTGAPGMGTTINGYPYLINNDMDQLQTVASSPVVTRKTLLFGDFTKYTVRRVKDISILRLNERFADFGQVAFIAFARYDGQLLDAGTHPVKYMSNVG